MLILIRGMSEKSIIILIDYSSVVLINVMWFTAPLGALPRECGWLVNRDKNIETTQRLFGAGGE